jgi:serine protease Do
MPIDACVLNKIRSLKDGREIVYGYLGVVVSNPTLRQRRDGGAKDADPCVRVDSVEKGSPADNAGLRAGDLLLAIDDQSAGDSDQFVRMMGEMPVGCAATLKLMRNRKAVSLNVTPARRQQPGTPITRDLQRLRWRGILVGPKPLNPNDALPGVMVFAVEPNSPFAKDGIASGAVITALGGARVTDLFTFQRLINDTPADRCSLTLAPATDNVATAK